MRGVILDSLTDQNTEREAQLVDRQIGLSRQLNRELRALDEHLDLVFVNDNATAPGLHPGRWHVRRQNPGTVHTFWPLIGERGEYVEPSLDIVDKLRARDMWRDDIYKVVRRHEADEKAKAEAALADVRAEKHDEMLTRVKALSSPSIRYGGSGWTAKLKDEKR